MGCSLKQSSWYSIVYPLTQTLFEAKFHCLFNYFRIMVLVEGTVREYAAPADLLADSNSLFYSMAKDAGLV